MKTSLAEVAMPTADRLEDMAEALFLPMGVAGVYARTGLYESVVDALDDLITAHRPPLAEVLRLPPVMSRAQLETSGYLKSFPHLLGCVSCLQGPEPDIAKAVDRFSEGESWIEALGASDLVLTPAACYPVYPIAAARGPVSSNGLMFDVSCNCFRHEPSDSLDRLQSFRMREYICIGPADQALAFRQGWIERAQTLAVQLGLPHQVAPASDPFFGRATHFMAASQIQQALKFELLVPVVSNGPPTACMSFNYHRDHFASTWGLRHVSGAPLHTVCAAFGMDRLALALFSTHGLQIGRWPDPVRAALSL